MDQGSGFRADPHLPGGDRPTRGRPGGAATGNRSLTIFFDFDGTLVDVRERHYRTYRSVVAAFRGRPLSNPDYWRLKRRGARWAEVLSRSGVAAHREGPFLELFVAQIEASANLRLDRLFPGVEETLAALRRRGDRLVLLSLRRAQRPFHQQVHDLGIASAFERVCSGHVLADGNLAKVHLIGEVGFSPPAVVVGDTEADILAARRLGLAALGVSTGLRNRSYLRSVGADVVVDRIRQVPGIVAALSHRARQRA